jgi:hypothetical protein
MKKLEYTREEVLQRMLRTAADVWGLPSARLEAMDPLVRILLGAVSLEVERIGHAMHEADARIFDKITRYLLPEVMVGVEPGHAVVKLDPLEAQVLTRYDEMVYEQVLRRKENMNRVETREFSFSSAGDVPMSANQLVARIVGPEIGLLRGLDHRALDQLPGNWDARTIHLGFRGRLTKGDTVHLYFDWPAGSARERDLLSLPRTRAMDLKGRALEQKVGLRDNVGAVPMAENDEAALIEGRVRALYAPNFMHVRIPFELDKGAPEGATDALEDAGVKDAAELSWIKLELPPDADPASMHQVTVLDNCVPVINRKLVKVILRLQQELNIKLLDHEGAFIGMEKVESGHAQDYVRVPSADQVESIPGSYSIRHEATGRFDERDAALLLKHVLDEVREEKQAFTAMDVTSTTADLRMIEQSIERIERRMSGQSTANDRTYLSMRPFTARETAHVHYWSCAGEAANTIARSGQLQCKNPGTSFNGVARFVTTVKGAREGRSLKERIQQYRSIVLGRGRIVTRRDIMEHCRMLCGDRLKDVAVREGVMMSPAPMQGLVRCLDVELKFDPGLKDLEEIGYLRERVRTDLDRVSSLSIPLRIL